MAFGKDDKNLGTIAGFRAQARAHQAARPKSTGGAKPYFIDRFQPSFDEADQIRVIKGAYDIEIGQPDGTLITQTLFYFPYVEHFHATMKKGAICSAGPFGVFKNKGEPCYGCEKNRDVAIVLRERRLGPGEQGRRFSGVRKAERQ